jgi:hypothetical protein
MNSYSPRAENALQAAARRAAVPADLTSRIRQSVEGQAPAGPALVISRPTFAWCSALAASLLLVAGLWWGRSSFTVPAPAPIPPTAAAVAFSDLNPAHLISAGPVAAEMEQLSSDLNRALDYILGQPHPPS